MAGPINGYSAAVANANSNDAIALAQAAHDLAIGLITQSGYQSALATAAEDQASGLSSAALQYAQQEIVPDAKDTLAMAGSDLGATKAVDLVLANLQTALDANDKTFDLTLDNNDQTSGLAIAGATLTFIQNSSNSYDAAVDNLASTSPSVYSQEGAALADALNLQTQANAVASYNQSVSQVNAAWTLATTTDTATAAAYDALAAAGLVAGNSAAQAIYNQIMGQVAANQAALAAGSIQATLPTVATPPAIVTIGTTFAEVASLAGPAQDTFSNNGLNAPLGNSGYLLNLDTTSPAWYGGTSQLGEGLPLGTTINLVEHPPAPTAPAASAALPIVQLLGTSASAATPPQIVFLAGDPVRETTGLDPKRGRNGAPPSAAEIASIRAEIAANRQFAAEYAARVKFGPDLPDAGYRRPEGLPPSPVVVPTSPPISTGAAFAQGAILYPAQIGQYVSYGFRWIPIDWAARDRFMEQQYGRLGVDGDMVRATAQVTVIVGGILASLPDEGAAEFLTDDAAEVDGGALESGPSILDDNAPDDVWQLSPTARGQAIENELASTEYKEWFHLGAERGGTFELVDFQKDQTLVSLKSIDTAGTSWLGRMKAHIDDLATRGATINDEPANMVLDLRVQPGGVADAASLIEYGRNVGVTVIIREF